MAPEQIKLWLKRKRRNGVISSAFYAAVTLVVGLVVLALTFGFLFMGVRVLFAITFGPSHYAMVICLVVAALLTGVVIADSIHASRDDMSFIPVWLAREYIDIGPRLILEGYPHVRRAKTFVQMDIETCARVLVYLAGKATPSSRMELTQAFPGLNWSSLVAELRLFEGVIVFRSDAARVTLTMPLRLELRGLLGPRKKAEFAEEPQRNPVYEPAKLSPSEILGVHPTATLAEIKVAYRNRIKECHPDRFAGMDERSRSLAEEWTKSLNAAYETLVAQTRQRT